MPATLTLLDTPSSPITLQPNESRTVGRDDMAPGDPARKVVSRQQVTFSLSSSGVLRATRIGSAHSCLCSQPGRDLAKHESIELTDGETYFLHYTPERGPICGVAVAVAIAPPPSAPPAAAPPPPSAPPPPPPQAVAPPPPPPPQTSSQAQAAAPTNPPSADRPPPPPPPAVAPPPPPQAAECSLDKRGRAGDDEQHREAGKKRARRPADAPTPPAGDAPGPGAGAVSARQLRALAVTWRQPASRSASRVAIVLTLHEASRRLSARACDGRETRATEAPVPCPWLPLPPASALRAELKLHPVYATDRWRLVLHPRCGRDDGSGAGVAEAAAAAASGGAGDGSLQLDLRKPSSFVGSAGAGAAAAADGVATAARPLGGAGGGMVHALLDAVASLREAAAEHAATIVTLRASLEQREAALQRGVEQLRAAEAEELASLLPLLLAKQERLAALEQEAQIQGIGLVQDGRSD